MQCGVGHDQSVGVPLASASRPACHSAHSCWTCSSVATPAARRLDSASSRVRTARSWSASRWVGMCTYAPWPGRRVDPPLGLQPLQRLPDGLPADSQLRSQLVLHQVLSRKQRAGDDHLGQGLVDSLAKRLRPNERSGHGAGANGSTVGLCYSWRGGQLICLPIEVFFLHSLSNTYANSEKSGLARVLVTQQTPSGRREGPSPGVTCADRNQDRTVCRLPTEGRA